jgi:hypothetical protein
MSDRLTYDEVMGSQKPASISVPNERSAASSNGVCWKDVLFSHIQDANFAAGSSHQGKMGDMCRRETRGTLRLPPSALSINIETTLARRLLVKVGSGRGDVVVLPAQLAAAAVNSGKHCGSVELCLFTA